MTNKIIIYEQDQELRVRYVQSDDFNTWADKSIEEVDLLELVKNAANRTNNV